MNNNTSTVQACEVALAQGSVEISSGVFLNSQESILADQEGWDEEDAGKSIDLSRFPFWITTNDGQLLPIYGPDDGDLVSIVDEQITAHIAMESCVSGGPSWTCQV